MSARYQADYEGLGELMNGPEMQAAMRAAAGDVMARAAAAAPERTGEYRASFHAEAHAHGGKHGDRAEGRAVNDSPHSVLVEWHDGFHTLRDAVEELGAP